MSNARAMRSALGLSLVGLASKGLAIGKTILIAALFGASASLDGFWVAYTLPTLLPALLSTVITVAFVPRFMASIEGRTGAEAWRGANTLFTLILALVLLATGLMAVFTDALVAALAPGLDAATHDVAVGLTRVLLPCVPLLTLSSILSAVSNARERFLLPALEGVLTNVTVIAAALFCAASLGVAALTWGVLAGFVLQAGVLIWGNRDLLRSSLRPALALRHPDFRAPAAHVLPLLVGSAGAVLTSLVNQYFLSEGGAGAISAMAYASMFAFLPVEVFVQSVITTFYPAFGRHFARGDLAAARDSFADGLRFVLFLTLPCAVLLAVFAEPIMVVLLERGSFSADDTALTAAMVAVLSAAMLLRALAFFNYRVLHAALRPWLQVGIGLLGVATHVGLCQLWGERDGALGIAWATAASTLQSALLSLLAAAWLLRLRWHTRLAADVARLLLLASLMAVLAHVAAAALWPPVDRQTRALAALLALVAAGAVGLLTLGLGLLLGLRDLQTLRQRLRRG